MKFFIITCVFISSIFGADIDEFALEANYLRDYNSALQVAKKENKMIMLLVVADYCPWCKKFERKTLQKPEVSKIVQENFIPVVIDKNKEKGSYPKEYNTPLIPTVYFIDPHTQERVHETVAYMKKKEYISHINDTLELFKDKNK
ncbi:thioredoxin family protein [Sulfurimonas sp.]|nr:thioredoxin family protein [Sulfurimonas sp.]